MNIVKVKEGETYQPEPGWKRVSLAGSDKISLEYFEKPAGHTSPLHNHSNEQVCIIIKGSIKVVNGDGEESILNPGDSAWFASDEPHRVENAGEELAIGVDIFVPARGFDFWTKRLKK
ncbi:MAG: cupin domain-containing protein [Candidatus Marinimicrobia bacterium]|nr:cupin domain-containing protein [Candidatus Neomarinimicrobiota bacterium]